MGRGEAPSDQPLPDQPPPMQSDIDLAPFLGKHAATFEEVRRAKTPEATLSFSPLPHASAFDRVVEALQDSGYIVDVEAAGHAMNRGPEGVDRYVGVLPVRSAPNPDARFLPVVGVRNAHDRSFAFGLFVGAYVYGDEVLVFPDEIDTSRRRTKHFERELPAVLDEAMADVEAALADVTTRLGRLGLVRYPDVHRLNDSLVRMVEYDSIRITHLPRVKASALAAAEYDGAEMPSALDVLVGACAQIQGTDPVFAPEATRGAEEFLVGEFEAELREVRA